MTVREIRLFGDPVLKTKTRGVKNLASATDLVQDLLDTTALPGRAGVAANQIGSDLAVFAYSVNGVSGYLINPEILLLEGEPSLVEEGCLSLPGLWHPTLRYPRATVRGQLLDGSQTELSGEGLLAQAIQHECDHLEGLVYLDRLSPDQRKVAMKELGQQPWWL